MDTKIENIIAFIIAKKSEIFRCKFNKTCARHRLEITKQ